MKEYFYQFERGINEIAPDTALSAEITVTDLIVVYLNRFAPKFTFYHKSEKHNFFEFYYVAEGNMIVSIEGKEYHCTAGDFFLVPPMLSHAMLPDKSYCTGISVCFDGENLPNKTMQGVLTTQGKQIVSILLNTYAKNHDDSEFRPISFKSNNGFDQTKKDFGYKQLIKNLIETLLLMLIQIEAENKEKNFGTHREECALAKQLKALIHERYQENISLQELADAVGYSIPHICRTFKATYNETIVNYISKYKIEHALVLIEQADKSLREISDILGFDNISYFTKIFKKYTGMTPGAYKKFAQNNHLLNTRFLFQNIQL